MDGCIGQNEMIGKVLLIGLSFFNEKGTLIEQYQTHGTVKSIINSWIIVKQDDNSDFCIPYDMKSIKAAQPGIYRERSTGKEITDPDYFTSWTIENVKNIQNIEETKRSGFNGFIKKEKKT